MFSILFYLILQPVHARMISQRKDICPWCSFPIYRNLISDTIEPWTVVEKMSTTPFDITDCEICFTLYEALIRKYELRTRLCCHWSKELNKKKDFCKVYEDLKSEMRKWKVARLYMLRTSIYAVKARLDRLYASCSFKINVNQIKDKSLKNSFAHKSCFKNSYRNFLLTLLIHSQLILWMNISILFPLIADNCTIV